MLSTVLLQVMLLIGFSAVGYALDDVSNMRCNGTIAEIGDQQFDFQEKCGFPTATEENGQVWIYDRRPEDYVYYVTFSDGKVERIQVSGND
jgi:hypothetical protein